MLSINLVLYCIGFKLAKNQNSEMNTKYRYGNYVLTSSPLIFSSRSLIFLAAKAPWWTDAIFEITPQLQTEIVYESFINKDDLNLNYYRYSVKPSKFKI